MLRCNLKSEEEREWFATELEALSTLELEENLKFRILRRLLQSQAFDNFMAKKFASVKRYGAEGAESMMVFFEYLFHLSAQGKLVSCTIFIVLKLFFFINRFYRTSGACNAPSRSP